MKEKIFEGLKQAYSSLGLDESFLKAQASSLASLGFVTDENLSAVISAQKDVLEGIQRNTDSRVTSATKKARETALKEFEEKAKEEAKKKAEEEARKKAEEEANKDLPEWFKAFKAEQEAKNAERENMYKKLQDDYNATAKELEEAKAMRSQQERASKIEKLANELGIPKWRIEEGFNIASDSSDDAIKEHLTKVSQNIKTNSLPQKNSFQMTSEKERNETADAVAKSLIN